MAFSNNTLFYLGYKVDSSGNTSEPAYTDQHHHKEKEMSINARD